MSLSTIRDPILRDLGIDPSSSLNDDAINRVNDYINEAIADMSIFFKWDFGKATSTITLAEGEDTYSLVAGARLERVVAHSFYSVSDQNTITRISDVKFIRESIKGETGLPKFYRGIGVDSSNLHQIQVYPIPTSNEAGKIFTYTYHKDLTSLVNDSDVSEPHETIIRHLAKAKYHSYDQDFNNAQTQQNIGNALLRKLAAQTRAGQRFTPLTNKNYDEDDATG